LFQDDLYPDTAAVEHAVSADEWINGADVNPKLVGEQRLMRNDPI
jgi:hypothetical protein